MPKARQPVFLGVCKILLQPYWYEMNLNQMYISRISLVGKMDAQWAVVSTIKRKIPTVKSLI